MKKQGITTAITKHNFRNRSKNTNITGDGGRSNNKKGAQIVDGSLQQPGFC